MERRPVSDWHCRRENCNKTPGKNTKFLSGASEASGKPSARWVCLVDWLEYTLMTILIAEHRGEMSIHGSGPSVQAAEKNPAAIAACQSENNVKIPCPSKTLHKIVTCKILEGILLTQQT